MKSEIEKLEELKKATTRLVASRKKYDQLIKRRGEMSPQTNSYPQIDKASANITWHAMAHDKLLREVHALSVDCGISLPKDDYSEIWYTPSPFHKYKYLPPVPECRK